MSNDPLLSRLGFARKAGKLSFGFAASKESILSKKAKLIIVASDISLKSEKEIRFFAKGIPVAKIDKTLEEISSVLSFRAGILSVNDQGFADYIAKQLAVSGNLPDKEQ